MKSLCFAASIRLPAIISLVYEKNTVHIAIQPRRKQLAACVEQCKDGNKDVMMDCELYKTETVSFLTITLLFFISMTTQYHLYSN